MSKSKAKPVKGEGYQAVLRVFKPDPRKPGEKIYQTVKGELIATKLGLQEDNGRSVGAWVFQIAGDAKHTVHFKSFVKGSGNITKYIYQIVGYPDGVGYDLAMPDETFDEAIGGLPYGESARFKLVATLRASPPAKPAPAAEPIKKKTEEKKSEPKAIEQKKEAAGGKGSGTAKAARIPKSSHAAYKKVDFVSRAADSKTSNRPALELLCLEKSGDGTIDLVATTSHILNWAIFKPGDVPALDALVPGLYRMSKTKDEIILNLEDADTYTYPSWRIVIPEDSGLEEVSYGPSGGFSFDIKEIDFAKSFYRLARAGFCGDVNLLKLLAGFSWGAKVNEERSLARFDAWSGYTKEGSPDCKSLVMGIRIGVDDASKMGGKGGFFGFGKREA